eukprot:CAMPEP_0202883098 /NCGR_PEP_ID=MMETSP1391-20130828/38954_1 /ASSEMBLY_ACC=CAM_ASM_000867 /TAXON_ID=1034604 /ORGANISM="Chlamydomonas leiostraca, Strain SAG 11-49" /LENGTH=159 /DNA_ID=CAMNT_0049566063 /DNA_START=59 /DNA_END=538 /DNA_ORIENTATION=-
MADEHIKQLILADRKATGRRQEDPRAARTSPKTEFNPPPPKRDMQPLTTQPPFSPINPTQAKDSVRRPWAECALGMGNPYDGDTQAFRVDKHSDDAKNRAPFIPTCTAEAKTTIAVDYYLYSPDAETKAGERDTIRARGAAHKEALRELGTTRRGKTLV